MTDQQQLSEASRLPGRRGGQVKSARKARALTGHLATAHFGLSAPASALLRSMAAHVLSELGEFGQGIRPAKNAAG